MDLQQSQLIKPGSFVTSLNMEAFVLAQKHSEFRKTLLDSDLILPDGVSISLIFNLLSEKKIKKLAGIDLASKLISQKQKIAFIGAKPEVIEILKKKFPDKEVFAQHGFFLEQEEKKIAKKIADFQPDLVLVGMGLLKQEKFVMKHRKAFAEAVVLVVGGSLDVFSGSLKRAPKIFIDLGLEWFFRIVQEPYRMNRFLYNVCKYIFYLFKYRFDKNFEG